MKHRIKAGAFALVVAHLVLGGAAIHAAVSWIFDDQDQVATTHDSTAQANNQPTPVLDPDTTATSSDGH